MPTTLLVFPHQLFQRHPGLRHDPDEVWLIEDTLFFGDPHYPMQFHKQKLWLHRASMKRYQRWLEERGQRTSYIDFEPNSPTDVLLNSKHRKNRQYIVAEPDDFILRKRLHRFAISQNTELKFTASPMFLNSRSLNQRYRQSKKRWFMADFYRFQRTRLKILVDNGKPVGGKWSFDTENRKKVPKQLLAQLPEMPPISFDEIDEQARQHVSKRFQKNPGSIDQLYYPTSHRAAAKWLKCFLEQRFDHFGDYEDAIVQGESWLWHSVLTPMLNVGLLTPKQIVDATLKHADQREIPLNSLEGFIRQVIGWREFMRATYDDLGVRMRTTNHWGHHRPIPHSFWNAETGIPPIDDTISRVLETGYCHHIERLMLLGGFMFLCEFDPDEIYKWFMEMFVDSYDWVMVPNAYAMSQNADGGLITTKPYFSGSSYVRKMSNHPKGKWCDVWDGLYWRWIWNHVDELSQNPRWAMMCSAARKMDSTKRATHLKNAEMFFNSFGSHIGHQ